MVRVDELAIEEAAEEVRQRGRIRRRDQEPAVRFYEQLRGFEEPAWLIQMLDQLAGKEDVRGLELERPNVSFALTVGCKRNVAQLAGQPNPVFVRIDAHSGCRVRSDVRVQPRAQSVLCDHPRLVDEPDVDNLLVFDEGADERGSIDYASMRRPVDGRRLLDPMHSDGRRRDEQRCPVV